MNTRYQKIGPRATSFCDPNKWTVDDTGHASRTWYGYTAGVWQQSDGRWMGSLSHPFYPMHHKKHGPFSNMLMAKLVVLDDLRSQLRLWRHAPPMEYYMTA